MPPPTREGSAPTGRPSQIIATDQAAKIKMSVRPTIGCWVGCPPPCPWATCPVLLSGAFAEWIAELERRAVQP